MKIPKDQIPDIIRRYIAGESPAKIAADYAVAPASIRGLIVRRNVETRDASTAKRTHELNTRYFKNIDSQEKAYWLGFIMADGCVHGNQFKINLSEDDYEHLVKLKNALGSSHPISIREIPCRPNRRIVSLSIKCKALVNDLHEQGIIERKSKTAVWPSIRLDLERHFLRGLFDGDGCFEAIVAKGKSLPSLVFSIAGSPMLIPECQDYLIRNCSLRKTKLKPSNISETVTVRYGGNQQIKRIYDLMYLDAEVYLERKQSKAESALALSLAYKRVRNSKGRYESN